MRNGLLSALTALLLVLLVTPAQAQDDPVSAEEAIAAHRVLRAGGHLSGPQNTISVYDLTRLAAAGEVEAVRLFLTLVPDPSYLDQPDRFDRRPLLVAAEAGHAEVVRLLVEAGADLSVRDALGRTPLVLATAREQDDVVRVILDSQAKR